MTWQWPQQQQQQLQQLLLRPEPHYPKKNHSNGDFSSIRMHSNVFAIFHSSWQSSFECSIRMEAVPFQTLESVLRMHSSFRMFVEEWEYEWIPFLGIPIPRTCGGLYTLIYRTETPLFCIKVVETLGGDSSFCRLYVPFVILAAIFAVKNLFILLSGA